VTRLLAESSSFS